MHTSPLNPRNRTILRSVAATYVETGEAVGSRTLSKNLAELLGLELSPATIRNAMAELEEAGLLASAHTSAGRIPTEAGLRLFVNSLMETKVLDPATRVQMQNELRDDQHHLPHVLERAGMALASLSQCAGLVASPKIDRPFKQVEFVALSSTRVLVVHVAEDGHVENRLIAVEAGITPSDLRKAGDFLNRHLYGRTLAEARTAIAADVAAQRATLDTLTRHLVEQGLVIPGDPSGSLIVRGQAHLLHDVRGLGELARLRKLFDTLDQRETVLRLMEQAQIADGVQIFIGAGHEFFDHSGCAMIVAPYKNTQQQVIGAIGVIGPARLNYARIIPMVDFTAKLLSGVSHHDER